MIEPTYTVCTCVCVCVCVYLFIYINTRNPGRKLFQSNNPHIPTQNQSLEDLKARSEARDRLELAGTSLYKMHSSFTASAPGHPRTKRVGRCQDGKNGLVPVFKRIWVRTQQE